MSASGIRMGRVYVEIGADQKALNKALSNIQKQVASVGKNLQTLGSRMAAAGVSGVTAFVGATKVFANAGDALRDMSLRTGASVEALSSLGYVAAQSGADLGTLEGGMRRIAKVLEAARGGNKAAAAAFSSLGISLQELSSMSPDEQLLRVGDALAAIPDPTARAAAAMKIFGKQGTALLPMLREGSGRIREMQAEAKRLGVVMSTEDANAADEFNDSLAKLKYVVAGGANAIGASLAPALTAMSSALAEGIGRLVRFIRDNQDMVRVALVAAAALTAAGAATWTLGTAMVAASRSFSVAAQAASTLLGPVRLLSNIGTVVAQSFLVATAGVINFGIASAVAMAGVLGPIGLVGVAIAGIGVAVAAQSGAFNGLASSAKGALEPIAGLASQARSAIATAFNQVAADAMKAFGDLWDIASTTFQGVADAMATGDIAGAAEMLWLGIQAAWQRGQAAIMSYWDPFVTTLQDGWTSAATFVMNTADAMWTGLMQSFNTGTAFLQGAWTTVSTTAMNAVDYMWTGIQQGFKTGLAVIMGVVDNLVNAVMNQFDVLAGEVQKSWNRVQGFFRKGFDVKKENAKVDSATAARRRERELTRPGVEGRLDAAQKANAELEAGRQKRTADRNAEEAKNGVAGRLGRAAAENDQAQRDLRQRQDQRIAEGDKAMADRQARNDALAKSRQAAVAETDDAMRRKAGELADNRAEMERRRKADRDRVGGKLDAIGAPTSTKSEVAGSFSASAAGQMSFGKSLAQKQVDLLQRIADNTDDMGDAALVGD